MGSYGLPIGGRWIVSRRCIDPGNRICHRTRMEAVEKQSSAKDEAKALHLTVYFEARELGVTQMAIVPFAGCGTASQHPLS
jgi:hypothetical protein